MGPTSLMHCFLPLLPQPRASLTSAPHPRASMPTCRSIIFPTQRPSLRLAISRYVQRDVCSDGGEGQNRVTCSHVACPSLSPTETSGALLCPRQGTLSRAIQGELFFPGQQEKLGDSRHGKATWTNVRRSLRTWALGPDCLGLTPDPSLPALLSLSLGFPICEIKPTRLHGQGR